MRNSWGIKFMAATLPDFSHLLIVVVHREPGNGNVKKCAVGKHPKSEKHGNTAQFSEVERSGTQENCGGIGSGCRLRLRPLPVLRRRQSQRVARIDPNAVVVDKNISTLSAARSAFIINCCSGPRAQAATHWPR